MTNSLASSEHQINHKGWQSLGVAELGQARCIHRGRAGSAIRRNEVSRQTVKDGTPTWDTSKGLPGKEQALGLGQQVTIVEDRVSCDDRCRLSAMYFLQFCLEGEGREAKEIHRV